MALLNKKGQKENIIPTVSIKLNREQCLLLIGCLITVRDNIDYLGSGVNDSKKESKEIEDLLEHIKNS